MAVIKGKVSFFSDARGFGFILGDDGTDYWVHVNDVRRAGIRTLKVGEIVEFQKLMTLRGVQAKKVVVQEAQAPEDSSVLVLRQNPFTPQEPISDSKKFAGRQAKFRSAVHALYNSSNILVTGPRGIGKSSIAFQLLNVAGGETDLLERFKIDTAGKPFQNLKGDHRCLAENSLLDIANGLLHTLAKSAGVDSLSFRIEHGSKLSVGGDALGLEIDEKLHVTRFVPTDISNLFVDLASKIFRECDHEKTGMTFMVDEIDVLEDELQLGPFIKSTIEKFRMENHKNVSFVVSGVTGTLTRLMGQHQSTGRLFESIEIDTMKDEELREIVRICLENTGVAISPIAEDAIIAQSGGFPQPVQLIGYHAFRISRDAEIGVSDVDLAVTDIVNNVRRQDFDNSFRQIGQGNPMLLVRAIALAPMETVNRGYLRNILGWKDEDIDTEIDKISSVIERLNRNTFAFQDPLFRIYVRICFGKDR